MPKYVPITAMPNEPRLKPSACAPTTFRSTPRTALVDGAEAVDEKVVADVVPAVPLDVVELDRADDRGRLAACSCSFRPCGGRPRTAGCPRRRASALRIASSASQPPRVTICGIPAAATVRNGTFDTGLRTVSALRGSRAHRPHLEPVAAADPDGRSEAPARNWRASAVPESGASPSSSCTGRQRVQPFPVRIRNSSQPGPASGCRRAGTARRSPPRASARRARGSSRPAASRVPRTRSRGREREDDEWEEATNHAERKPSVTQDAFSGKTRAPSLTECTRRRTAAWALLQSKST